MNESIKQLITCKWCHSILDEPILLPCNETVCGKHTSKIRNSKCRFCDTVHVLNESENCPPNKVIQDLFKLRIKELDFGPNHKKASERITELNNFLNDYDNLKKDPNEYISAHYSKKRNNIDLAREKLIFKINQISESLISETNLQEKECKANLSKCNLSSFSNDLTNIKAEISKWEQEVKYLVVNDHLWTSITTNCSMHLEQLKRSRMEFEEKLLGSSCELKTESDLSNVFIKQLTT
jgi:hypothetical protein